MGCASKVQNARRRPILARRGRYGQLDRLENHTPAQADARHRAILLDKK